MNRKNDLHPYMFEQSINTSVVVACLNDFCQRIKKKTMVIMDNSSIHRSEEFEEYLAQWKKKGLRIKYLIPYAPELNLIEILWRHIKYLWLPFSAYQCMETLREALEHILKDFGSKYQITFAGLDHGVGHSRPLSITRQRHLLAYHFIAMRHEGLFQVF